MRVCVCVCACSTKSTITTAVGNVQMSLSVLSTQSAASDVLSGSSGLLYATPFIVMSLSDLFFPSFSLLCWCVSVCAHSSGNTASSQAFFAQISSNLLILTSKSKLSTSPDIVQSVLQATNIASQLRASSTLHYLFSQPNDRASGSLPSSVGAFVLSLSSLAGTTSLVAQGVTADSDRIVQYYLPFL